MTQVSGSRRGDFPQAVERLFLEGTVSGLSEAQLLERFATRRDESAFEALVERHGPMVLGVCRRFLHDPNDVDDAFQAVFLVLVRRAGDIRQKDLLGNWLYGVACRVAVRARGNAARRPSTLVSEADGVAVSSRDADDWGPCLHEEVERLPRRYRAPVVACYFEGRTHEEAASLLGCPLGTVKGRLSRARDILRKRLERRGVAVPTVVLGTFGLSSLELRASVPEPLLHSTVRAGVALAAAGSAGMTTSAISLSVRTLTEGVLHAMVVSHVKSLVLPLTLVWAGVLAAGATVAAGQRGAPGGVASPPQEPRKAELKAPPAEKAPKKEESGAEAIPDSDLEFLRFVDTKANQYDRLLERLESDPLAPSGSPSSEKAYALHRARVKSLIEQVAKQAPTSEAGKELKIAFIRVLDAGSDLSPGGRMIQIPHRQIEKGYTNSLQQLRNDLSSLPSLEERKLARELHKTKLDSLVRVLDPNIKQGTPQADFYKAYLSFLEKVDADPEHPRSFKEPQSANAPAAAPNPPVAMGGFGGMGGMMGMGGGGGGGFDFTGGGASEGLPDEVYRRLIAQISAALARIDASGANQSVLKALEKPITVRSTDKSTLQDLLKQIRENARTAEGGKIPIYVDPIGLQEAEKTLDSPVMIDLEGVPAKFSLRLMLKQLGLAYCVRDGVLIISSLEGIYNELMEAQGEQMGLNPEKYPRGIGGGRGMGGGMGGMGGGMGGMGGGMGGGQGMM